MKKLLILLAVLPGFTYAVQVEPEQETAYVYEQFYEQGDGVKSEEDKHKNDSICVWDSEQLAENIVKDFREKCSIMTDAISVRKHDSSSKNIVCKGGVSGEVKVVLNKETNILNVKLDLFTKNQESHNSYNIFYKKTDKTCQISK